MDKSDEKLFWGLTIMAVGLVAVALVVGLRSLQNPGYEQADTPQAAFHNFVVAINRGDYRRAYGLIANTPCRPDYNTFRSFFASPLSFTDAEILSTKIEGDRAVLKVRVSLSWEGPFFAEGATPVHTGEVTLQHTPQGWRIASLPPSLPLLPIGGDVSNCPWRSNPGGD